MKWLQRASRFFGGSREFYRSQARRYSSMTPEQAKFLLDVFLPSVQKEHATTVRVLQEVPTGHENYRPHPNSRSTLELVWHVAGVDIWFLDGFLAGNFSMEDDTMPADFSTAADIALWYEEAFPPKLEK